MLAGAVLLALASTGIATVEGSGSAPKPPLAIELEDGPIKGFRRFLGKSSLYFGVPFAAPPFSRESTSFGGVPSFFFLAAASLHLSKFLFT